MRIIKKIIKYKRKKLGISIVVQDSSVGKLKVQKINKLKSLIRVIYLSINKINVVIMDNLNIKIAIKDLNSIINRTKLKKDKKLIIRMNIKDSDKKKAIVKK